MPRKKRKTERYVEEYSPKRKSPVPVKNPPKPLDVAGLLESENSPERPIEKKSEPKKDIVMSDEDPIDGLREPMEVTSESHPTHNPRLLNAH